MFKGTFLSTILDLGLLLFCAKKLFYSRSKMIFVYTIKRGYVYCCTLRIRTKEKRRPMLPLNTYLSKTTVDPLHKI